MKKKEFQKQMCKWKEGDEFTKYLDKLAKMEKINFFYEEPKREKVFWYVFVPGNGQPTEKHYSFQFAKAEALRIAKKTGKETFILQAIKSYKPNDIIETNFVHEDKKKFKREKAINDMSRFDLFVDFIDKQGKL